MDEPTGAPAITTVDQSKTSSGQPIGMLRNSRADVDMHRAGRVAFVVLLLALLGTSIGLFAAGASKNSQINELRNHGIAVQVTVTECQGNLGGSGSNGEGFTCRGTYTVNGKQQSEYIPGLADHEVGSHIAAVSSRSDPGLLATKVALLSEHASASVFVAPIILLAVFLLLGGLGLTRKRKTANETVLRTTS